MAALIPLIYLHGGEVFPSKEAFLAYIKEKPYNPFEEKPKRWPETLEALPGYQLFRPSMPCKECAHFEPWKLTFEKVFPYLTHPPVIVAWSLGGIFILKYLSEYGFPTAISSLHLVATPYKDCEDFNPSPGKLSRVSALCKEVHFYHSEDDFVVDISALHWYKKHLPQASFHVFSDRNHFLVETFPELTKALEEFAKKSS